MPERKRSRLQVGLCLLVVHEGSLHVVLEEQAEAGHWNLPNTLVAHGESLGEGVLRLASTLSNATPPLLNVLDVFEKVAPGGRRPPAVSVTYVAAAPYESVVGGVGGDPRLYLCEVDFRRDGTVEVWLDGRLLLRMEKSVLRKSRDHMALMLELTDVDFCFLPDEFTLGELQHVHEAILGRRLSKPAFRKRMVGTGRLIATGIASRGNAFRPAQLYRPRLPISLAVRYG